MSKYINTNKGIYAIEARVQGLNFFKPRGKHVVKLLD